MALSGGTGRVPVATGDERSVNETNKTRKPKNNNVSGVSKQKRQARKNSVRGSEKFVDDRRGKGGSVLWTILLVGLLFSLVDVFYIVNLMDRIEIPNRRQVTPQVTPIAGPDTELINEKGYILDLLRRGGIDPSILDAGTLKALPSWDEVVTLYGPEPIIYGLDRCHSFQDDTNKLGFVGSAGE